MAGSELRHRSGSLAIRTFDLQSVTDHGGRIQPSLLGARPQESWLETTLTLKGANMLLQHLLRIFLHYNGQLLRRYESNTRWGSCSQKRTVILEQSEPALRTWIVTYRIGFFVPRLFVPVLTAYIDTWPKYFSFNRGRLSLVGRAFDCKAEGLGFDSRKQTNTQGLKITEK